MKSVNNTSVASGYICSQSHLLGRREAYASIIDTTNTSLGGSLQENIDPDSSSYSRELQIHADYLNRAYWVIRDRYPDLNIELYFVTLNGSVKAVFPIEQN